MRFLSLLLKADPGKLMVAGVASFLITMGLLVGTWRYAPNLLWLAGLCSIGIAYFTYEFSDVLKAVPVALKTASTAAGVTSSTARRKMMVWAGEITAFLREKHPFFYSSLMLGVSATYLISLIVPSGRNDISPEALVVFGVMMFSLVCLVLGVISAALLWGIATLGQKPWGDHAVDLEYHNYGYARFMLWVVSGLLALLLWYSWKFAGITLREFFKLIHSNKRLMVAVDGPLCGFVTAGAYWRFGPEATGPLEYMFVLAAGSLLTMAVIYANYEWVARRWYGFFAKSA